MAKCRTCNIEILDETNVCPLCMSILEPTMEVENMYPDVRDRMRWLTLACNIYLFLALCAEALMVYIDISTMSEIPRAALSADEIAEEAEFFSFGTNDLTQMTFGFSRDDTGKLLQSYVDKEILPEDPFQVIDEKGVGKLVSIASTLGRQTRPDLKLGICGEHGGNPKTIDFCHRVGLNYVSCSPFRVPIARLAAAQAAVRNK